ncbi:MAG: hypothetical protein QW098_01120 [Candidatus Hadarchaeales archaeon]
MNHRNEIERIRAVLTAAIPFISSLVRKSRIVFHPTLPFVSAVDENSVIHLGEDFFSLSFEDQAFVLGHEALHVSLLHPLRAKRVENPFAYNLAADVVVCHLLGQLMHTQQWVPPWEELRLPEGWEGCSVEEIYEWLKRSAVNLVGGRDLTVEGDSSRTPLEGIKVLQKVRRKKMVGWDLLHTPPEGGEVLQEGDSNLYGGTVEEREEGWREVMYQAMEVAKQAGKLPAGVARSVEEMLKPKLPVRSLLRQYIREGIGKTVVGTWTRESRKTPDMPGIRRFTVPNIWALVDTSGSIGEEELSLFVGTIYEFNSLANITVVCWDGEAYEPIKLKQKSQVLERLREKMRGGGGTIIIPALKKTLEEMRGANIVLVLSDGHIYDWDKAKPYLAQVARKALFSVLLWTDKEIKHPLWKSLKLTAEH